jgi:small-conductance mechanosensitive channel
MGLLASAGVLSVLIGVAAQPVLGNIISGAQIAISRPVRVGDSIVYEGTWCYVEDITYMYVLCRTWDEKRLVIPLLYFTSKPFSSYSLRDPRALHLVELKVDYTVDVDALRSEYERLVEVSELWDDDYEPKCEVVAFEEESVKLRMFAWAGNASRSWDLHCELREGLLKYLQSDQQNCLPRLRISGQFWRTGDHPDDI